MGQVSRPTGVSAAHPGSARGFAFGPFQLHVGERLLRRHGSPVRLGARAFDILTVLVERAGQVVGHQELTARVWAGLQVSAGTPRVHLAALRRVLDCRPERTRYIANIPGRGYCFVAPVARTSDDAGRSAEQLFATRNTTGGAIAGIANGGAGHGAAIARGRRVEIGSYISAHEGEAEMTRGKLALAAAITLLTCVAAGGVGTARAESAAQAARVVTHYRTATVGGLSLFYREAGPADAPVVLLLHGFPTSSHMFRNLIPTLADRYHVIAPDYPGFGQSAAPDHTAFAYSFANYATMVDQLLQQLGASRYAMYVMDYGAPVGYRLALLHPERVTALIVQNGNAYVEGLGPFWDPIKAYWADGSEARRRALDFLVKPETTKFQYTDGVQDVSRIDPDNWVHDQALLDRPGNRDIQLDLFRDYGTNVPLYPDFQAFFRTHQPPTLIVWGRNDKIFPASGAGPYLRDLPKAELHLLDTGHFALEDQLDVMAPMIGDFLDRSIGAK